MGELWRQGRDTQGTRLGLQTSLGFTSFTLENHHPAIQSLTETAMVNDRGLVVAEELVDSLRQRKILLPSLLVIEKICAEAITRGNRAVYAALTEDLGAGQCRRLDGILRVVPGEIVSPLAWLRESPGRSNSKQMSEHLDRLTAMLALIAEMERTYAAERTSHARTVAAAHGRQTGRPSVVDPDKLEHALMLRDKGVPIREIVSKTGLARTTLYRHPPPPLPHRHAGKVILSTNPPESVRKMGPGPI